jgi:hypothetical protein
VVRGGLEWAVHGEQEGAGVEGGSGGGVWAPVARGKKNRGKWMECSLLALLGNRRKEEEQA